MSRDKGFTLAEMVVVFAVVFLALIFVLPLGGSDIKKQDGDIKSKPSNMWWEKARGKGLITRARARSNRVKCAAQLRGLGTATVVYYNDYDDKGPQSFHVNNGSSFGQPAKPLYPSNDGRYAWKDWEKKDQPEYPDKNQWDVTSSVGSCLFLLVRYECVAPKAFVCPNAAFDKEMDFAAAIEDGKEKRGVEVLSWEDIIDFKTSKNLSYSMNDPWGNPIGATSNAGMAYLADKSNKFDNPFTGDFSPRFTEKSPNWHPKNNAYWHDQADLSAQNQAHGNSNNHGTENQNVLFADGHVDLCETPLVGIDKDNIYTAWPKPKPKQKTTQEQKKLGIWGSGIHAGKKHTSKSDSYLGN